MSETTETPKPPYAARASEDFVRMTLVDLATEKRNVKHRIHFRTNDKADLAAQVAFRTATLKKEAYTDPGNTNDKSREASFKVMVEMDDALRGWNERLRALEFELIDLDAILSLLRDLQRIRLAEMTQTREG